jgi:hypothetical protein
MRIEKLKFIEQISRKTNNNTLFNLYNSCRFRLVALQIIKNRYDQDVKELLEANELLWKDIDNPLPSNPNRDQYITTKYFVLSDQTRLDHESFIIYSRTFMDNIAQVAKFLINHDLPNSFSSHKKWYINNKYNNNLNLNLEYSKLVNNHSNWFDLNLKFSRDKFIIHTDSKMIIGGISHNSQNITFSSVNKLRGSEEGHRSLLELKKKYENVIPNLLNINNFWELYEFFYYHENYLTTDDICKLLEIGRKNGVFLSNIDHIINRIQTFLDDFHKLFISNLNIESH